MNRDETPPMPTTEAEWAVFWAFYRLTVVERDAARREAETLRKSLLASIRVYPKRVRRRK